MAQDTSITGKSTWILQTICFPLSGLPSGPSLVSASYSVLSTPGWPFLVFMSSLWFSMSFVRFFWAAWPSGLSFPPGQPHSPQAPGISWPVFWRRQWALSFGVKLFNLSISLLFFSQSGRRASECSRWHILVRWCHLRALLFKAPN